MTDTYKEAIQKLANRLEEIEEERRHLRRMIEALEYAASLGDYEE